ncbi:helix-turn-helix domain-containing protein [Limosilactobacillus vaginalis]|uniref:DNA-binding helix-turn-helix protein n=1 Tax=Limosilactobacillus vaginalis DSM 5837 = ATCC 49540 TaxID=1423814 RepID=C2EWB6_9LACO|nr:helix-turn-helix transcriptional regulator [Limosilactobacillus vaginalis]EEJ39802.1 DNA-binding helix-turn-helix protein [Limosilactobacillus vaginalis DSM 5837 = ATCC 49540]KRM49044.1 bacteriophage transcriptional regulator [Limosilactobacillus vaginalis DSM 5837 = ATCC 49540]QFS34357.1 helix-turn-helix domain-containing protein [Limosilactobacillus vaginalis]
MNLADRIKDLANKHGITIAELERKTGISNGQISKWNVRSPKTENLEKVANYFHVSLDYLIGNTSSNKTADLDDDDVIFTYQGKPLSDEDKALIKRLMNGKD